MTAMGRALSLSLLADCRDPKITPGNNTPTHFAPEPTIEWMLGDNTYNNSSNPTGFTNVIAAPDRLSAVPPFILISAGPDGPNRANGGFCNFLNQTTGNITDASGNPLTAGQLQQLFTNSGNIYNFDRP